MTGLASESKLERLKKEMPFRIKATRGHGRYGEKLDNITPYRPGVKLCLERARLVTEAYRESEGEPMVIRRAKAIAKVLDNMTIYIQPWEIIVGNFARDPDSIQHYPELFWRWLDKAVEEEYRSLLTDEERVELHELHRYWKNMAVHGMERKYLPESLRPYTNFINHGAFIWLHGGRTGVPNYEKLFRVGLKGIIEEAKEKFSHLEKDESFYLKAADYMEKRDFYQAVIISLEAGCRWGKRYAKLARELAAKEKDSDRKEQLLRIAEVCDWVPENPPRTFHEALQFYFFIVLITRVIDLQTPGLGERFDQIMMPFYVKDLKEGRINREKAKELIEYCWLKMNEFGELIPPLLGGGLGSVITARVTTIGGQTPEGDDATNEMTYIVLEAIRDLKLSEPSVAVRIHRHSPRRLLEELTDSLRECSGVFSLFNDEMMIPYLVSLGIPIEDARNYSTEGCMRWIIPGKSMGFRALGGLLILPKCLEYAFTQGVNIINGNQIGSSTKDPLAFTSFEELLEAYFEQVRFFTEKLVAINNIVEVLDQRFLPQPFLSALLDECLERGQDCRYYKYFNNTIIQPIGQVTVVNSLAAVKKLVFEEKRVSMAELVEALKNNWEGKEDLRQMFIHKAPKFGNDDDYVDLLARKIYAETTRLIRNFKNIYGTSFLEDGTGGSTYYFGSVLCGATPDGRKARDLFNDGTVSPVPGTDRSGPTAVLKSVAKLDHVRGFTHLLNQSFLPETLEGENKEKFISYLRCWSDLGIHHIQFNVFGPETLEDAQLNPDKYGTLVVRVAGFSAYFVDLDKMVQDQIISRTRQKL